MKNIKKSKYLVVGNFILVNNIYCDESKGCCNCRKNNNPNGETGSKTETTKEEKPKPGGDLTSKRENVKNLYNEVSGLYGDLSEEQQNKLTKKTEFENINNNDIENETDISKLNNIENLLTNIKGFTTFLSKSSFIIYVDL